MVTQLTFALCLPLYLLILIHTPACETQYTGYSPSGQMKIKVLVKGSACGSSDVIANKVVGGLKPGNQVSGGTVLNVTLVSTSPPESTCTPPPDVTPPPSNNSTNTSTTGGSGNSTLSSEPVTVTVFADQAYKTTITVAPFGMSKLQFTITTSHTGMVAIGFPTRAQEMTNSDAIIGWVSTSTAASSVADYTIGNQRTGECETGGVCKDWEQNIEHAEASVVQGNTVLKFVRARIPTDNTDMKMVAPAQLQNFNIALGGTNSISYHGTKRTSSTFVMPAGVPDPPSSETAVTTSASEAKGAAKMDSLSTTLFIVVGVVLAVVLILVIVLVVLRVRGTSGDYKLFESL